MTTEPRHVRSSGAVVAIVTAALAGAALLGSLGVWQMQRLDWKLDLVARIEQRLAAQPVPAPGRDEWGDATAASGDYLKVRVTGRFLHERETLVQAVTDLGGGFWVLTPLETMQGFTVLVNRGFVPPERRDPATRAAADTGATTVTGLLRSTEPGGAFLRENDPAQDRWYSRDVAAIASARNLSGAVAPYFIDADATPNAGGWPLGGLTRVSFPNNHLVYAVTWFTLALMALAGAAFVLLDRRRQRAAARPHVAAMRP